MSPVHRDSSNHGNKGANVFLSPFDVTDILLDHQEEGYSVNVHDQIPGDGYMVGGVVPSLVLDGDSDVPYTTTDAWIEGNWDQIQQPDHFVGVWTDSEDGRIYIDISRQVDDLYTALAIATARGEIAIWDVVNAREIRTEKGLVAKPNHL